MYTVTAELKHKDFTKSEKFGEMNWKAETGV